MSVLRKRPIAMCGVCVIGFSFLVWNHTKALLFLCICVCVCVCICLYVQVGLIVTLAGLATVASVVVVMLWPCWTLISFNWWPVESDSAEFVIKCTDLFGSFLAQICVSLFSFLFFCFFFFFQTQQQQWLSSWRNEMDHVFFRLNANFLLPLFLNFTKT